MDEVYGPGRNVEGKATCPQCGSVLDEIVPPEMVLLCPNPDCQSKTGVTGLEPA